MKIASSAYKEIEKALKIINKENFKPGEENTKLKLTICYKTKKNIYPLYEKPLFVNRQWPPSLIYRYTSNIGDCSRLSSTYISSTTMALSKILTAHVQDGASHRHIIQKRESDLTRQQLRKMQRNYFKRSRQKTPKNTRSSLHLQNKAGDQYSPTTNTHPPISALTSPNFKPAHWSPSTLLTVTYSTSK